MNKFSKIALASLLALGVAGCSSTKPAEPTPSASAGEGEKAETGTGIYDVTNLTGEKVTDLYVYTDAADKGDNLANGGLDKNASVKVTKADYPADTAFTLEFKTEGGYEGKFETLHVEEAPIYLLSKDLMTGATMISFKEPDATASYTVFNSTGETVKELYLYNTGDADKGENLAGEGLAAAASVELTKVVPATTAGDQVYTLEFTTESGYNAKFETLHFEVAPIQLLAGADVQTGATPISFKKPE